MKRCVVIAGGDFNVSQYNKKPDDFVIAADSGYDHCLKNSIKPHLIIGDFDSLKSSLPLDIEIIKLPEKKDDTDLLFALKTGVKRQFSEFLVLGGYGSRPDQNFAMLQSLNWLANEVPLAKITANCDKFSVSLLKDGSEKFNVFNNQYISVFALSESKGVTIKGAEYNIVDAVITPKFPVGVSNFSKKGVVEIEVQDGTLLVMIVDKDI